VNGSYIFKKKIKMVDNFEPIDVDALEEVDRKEAIPESDHVLIANFVLESFPGFGRIS
jgi:hypothetical protein